MTLTGDLALYVKPDQTFSGMLMLKNGQQVTLTGQGAGRSLDMIFYGANNQRFFAHGALEYDIYNCSGYTGGPLTGPKYGDTGDWTNYPPFIRVISGTR